MNVTPGPSSFPAGERSLGDCDFIDECRHPLDIHISHTMAAPLKRLCQQTARSASHCRLRPTRPSLAETTKCQQQQRLYTSASRLQKPENATEHEDLDTYLAELDENLPQEEFLSSAAHAELDQHREIREMVRLAAWEMPLLSELSKPFERVSRAQSPLQWRYTTYFGESHPASTKVAVQFRIMDVTKGWSEIQIDKLRKIAGTRYRPVAMKKTVDQVIPEHIHMSCESFESQAQNKRYLVDTINKLLAEAQDLSTDSFEDVPLDTRHDTRKKWLKYSRDFPEEWKLNDEKREALEEKRRKLLLAEARKVEQGRIFSGAAAIEHDRQVKLNEIEEPVMVQAQRMMPTGKMGKKEMGQKGR